MSDERRERAGWIIAMIYVVTLPVLVTALANWHHIPLFASVLWTQEAAGWAQAIFSVGAITTAIWVDRGSARRARQQSDDEHYRLGEILLHLSQQAERFTDTADATIAGGSKASPENIDTIIAAMDKAEMRDMPSGLFAIEFLNVRRCLHFLKPIYAERVSDLIAGRPSHQAVIDMYVELTNAIREHHRKALAEGNRILASRRSEIADRDGA